MERIARALDHLFLMLWVALMACVGLAIYKFAFFDTLMSWDYPNWHTIDWFIYIAGVTIYGAFWSWLALKIPYEVIRRQS